MGRHSNKKEKKRADDTSEYLEYDFDPKHADSSDHEHNYDYRTNGPKHKHRRGIHPSKRRGVVFITGGSLLVVGGAAIMWIPVINVVAGVPLIAAGIIAITGGSIDVNRKKSELKWRQRHGRERVIEPAASVHRVDRTHSNPAAAIQMNRNVELAPKGEGNQGQGWQRQEEHQYKPPLQYHPKPNDPYIPGHEASYRWGDVNRTEEQPRYDEHRNLLTEEMREEGRGDVHPEPTGNYREAMINPEADRAMDPTHPRHDNDRPVRGKHDVDLAKEEVTKDELFHAHSYGDHHRYHHSHHHHSPDARHTHKDHSDDRYNYNMTDTSRSTNIRYRDQY